MIPFLPELTTATAAPVTGGAAPALPQALPGAAAPLDFAGVLEAALPPLELPTGTILPDSGAPLPQAPLPQAPLPEVPTSAVQPALLAVALVPTLPVAAPTAPERTAPEDAEADPSPDTGSENEAAPVEDAAAMLMPLILTPPPAQPPATPATPPAAPSAPSPLAVQVRAAPVTPRAEQRAAARSLPQSAPQAANDPAPASTTTTATPVPRAEAPPAVLPTAAPAPVDPAAALLAAPPATPTPPMPERAEARPASITPQLENAIAAVGEIRDALRAVRPEMTLRHAEFGFVSLRLEAMGSDNARAVLASRDPGFIPAIQAALADRAVAASGDSAAANSGQNGPSDQRYGASPNSGQGSSQPYFGHSMNRNGDSQQHPHYRHAGTTERVAARAGESEADGTPPRERGVFA